MLLCIVCGTDVIIPIHVLFSYLDYTSSSYYNTLDLSDISKFENLMTMSSNEDISALDDIGY